MVWKVRGSRRSRGAPRTRRFRRDNTAGDSTTGHPGRRGRAALVRAPRALTLRPCPLRSAPSAARPAPPPGCASGSPPRAASSRGSSTPWPSAASRRSSAWARTSSCARTSPGGSSSTAGSRRTTSRSRSGPAPARSRARLAARVRTLIAVEKDAGLAALLREELAEVPQLELVEGDFLEFDLAEAARAHGVERVVVVGNIPYNITTPVLERIFEQKRAVKSAVLLVQKEYAERLAAAAGTPEYGSLTLFARYHALLDPLLADPGLGLLAAPRRGQHAGALLPARAAAGRGRRDAALPHHPRLVPHAPQAAREHAGGGARARARGHRAPLPRAGHRQPPPRRDAHARGVRAAGAGRGADRAGAAGRRRDR